MAFNVNEKVTAKISGVFKDEAGTAIGSGIMTTLTATLYNRKDGTIINSRNAQNILNLNGGTLDGSGNFTMTLDAVDNAIIGTNGTKTQFHVLLLQFTYSGGTKSGNQEIELAVKNLDKIT